MRRTQFSLKAELESRGGASGYLQVPGDAVLIQRGLPRWLLLKCPCGCGDEIPVNLDARAGKAWRLYRRPENGITLFPSVWRDTGCQSHFIIWRDQIMMFGPRFRSNNSPGDTLDLSVLSRQVLDAWPSGRLVHYVEVADAINEIPWDVQEACQRLVKKGLMVEAQGPQRGTFQKTLPD